MPPGARDKDGVEFERVVAVDEKVDFGKEVDDDLVSKQTSATLEAQPKEPVIKTTRTTKTKAEEEAIAVKNTKRRKKKTKMEDGREILVAKVEDEEVSS